MNGHGIGGFQLVQLGKVVVRRPIVEGHRQGLCAGVDPGDRTHVAVENAGAYGAAVGLLPHYIIIVANLHHPVPLPENNISESALLFVGSSGVQGGLQHFVQGSSANAPLAGGRQHLNLLRWNAHVLGQPGGA